MLLLASVIVFVFGPGAYSDRYFPLQGRRTTISISTLISGL